MGINLQSNDNRGSEPQQENVCIGWMANVEPAVVGLGAHHGSRIVRILEKQGCLRDLVLEGICKSALDG